MPEPEEVIIDAAHRAATTVARLWHRDAGNAATPDEWRLEYHRRRLHWLVAAAFGRERPIRVAQPAAPATVLTRLFGGVPRALRTAGALPATDGRSLFLPGLLPPEDGLSSGRRFRVLALLQAARAERMAAGGERRHTGPAGDLRAMLETAAAERDLVARLPGLAGDLAHVRATVRRRRPPLHLLTPPERTLERLYHALLADPGTPADDLDGWLREQANAIARAPGRYRGLPRDLWWGPSRRPPATPTDTAEAPSASEPAAPRTGRMRRRPEPRGAQPDEDRGPDGPWMIQSDDPLQHVEDGGGAKRPPDRDEGDAEGLADSLSELPQARLVTSPDPAREVLVGDDAPDLRARVPKRRTSAAAAVQYPEWDYRRRAYRRPGATVTVCDPLPGDPAWAAQVLSRRAALLHGVQRRFERLRPRRLVLGRQPDGEEVDVDAYVGAFADLRAGAVPEQRLYRSVRPARRELAITLLVDVSGSTDAWVGGSLRIIDVEKEALLVVCHALDTLGDPYSIQAFSGEGPERVAVWPLKGFEEHDRGVLRRRIAALGPERYTRAGAALRHAGAALAGRREQHRLLLLLSDGKPNDVDEYEGRYGVEDMRRAVVEATLQGLHCFCLTVDRQAPGYLNRVFGPGRWAVLRHPAELPTVLVEVLRDLLKR